MVSRRRGLQRQKKVGAVAAGVAMVAKSWPAPLQTDVQHAARIMSAAEAEALFMSKFGNFSVGGGGGDRHGGQSLAALLARVAMYLKAWMQSFLSECKKAR